MALLIFGFFFPFREYMTPKAGLGFGLGVAGAIAMLIAILGYSIPKRIRFFRSIKNQQSTTNLFNMHKVLGILGPIAILYHCGYHLGATNSNMALYSMITTVIAGLIGRYLYMTPGLAKYVSWWRMAHMPVVGMLILTSIIHIVAYLVY